MIITHAFTSRPIQRERDVAEHHSNEAQRLASQNLQEPSHVIVASPAAMNLYELWTKHERVLKQTTTIPAGCGHWIQIPKPQTIVQKQNWKIVEANLEQPPATPTRKRRGFPCDAAPT